MQLYLMYKPEYAVLQIATVNVFVPTVGPGCTNSRDCSDQGVCYRGYCVCFDGFVGEDCSVKGEQVPPNPATAVHPAACASMPRPDR